MASHQVRVDLATYETLTRVAEHRETTIGHTITIAVRSLQQGRMRRELTVPLRDDEVMWLATDAPGRRA